MTPQDKPADGDFPVFMAISPRTEDGDSERGTKPLKPDTEQHRPEQALKENHDSSPSDLGPGRTDGIDTSSDGLTPSQPHERFGTGAFLSD